MTAAVRTLYVTTRDNVYVIGVLDPVSCVEIMRTDCMGDLIPIERSDRILTIHGNIYSENTFKTGVNMLYRACQT